MILAESPDAARARTVESMSAEFGMPATAFAAWSRARGVALPYPIDLSAVPGAGVAVAADDPPALQLLRRVLGERRLAVFSLRADPDIVTDCAVAVGADRDGAVIRVRGDAVTLRRVRASELVAALADTLPDRAGLRFAAVELDEARWTRLLAELRRGGGATVRAATLADLGLPPTLVRAMDTASPVPVGTLGVVVWRGGAEHLGPTLATWHEYPDGAVLTSVLAPRRTGQLRVQIAPYDRANAVRTAGEAVATALFRTREAFDPAVPSERRTL